MKIDICKWTCDTWEMYVPLPIQGYHYIIHKQNIQEKAKHDIKTSTELKAIKRKPVE